MAAPAAVHSADGAFRVCVLRGSFAGQRRRPPQGASGFLGVFLLHQLLTQTSAATLRCLVRPVPAAPEDLAARLRAHFVRALGATEADMAALRYDARVQAVSGELGPRLGQSAAVFAAWSRDVDEIMHAGALVNWAKVRGARLKESRVWVEGH